MKLAQVLRGTATSLLLVTSTQAADVVGDRYVQGPGGYYSTADRSGPYAIGTDGSLYLLGQAVVTASEIRGTGTLPLASGSTTPVISVLGGKGDLSVSITGLTGSGATLVGQTASVDGVWSNNIYFIGVNGQPTIGQAMITDGKYNFIVSGTAQFRLAVTNPGTGTVSYAYIATPTTSRVVAAIANSATGSLSSLPDKSCSQNTVCQLSTGTTRKYLKITNTTSSGYCRVGYSGNTPTLSNGDPLGAALVSGGQGGSVTFEGSYIPPGTINAICSVASTLAVLEGS